jgi:hypothetical protein
MKKLLLASVLAIASIPGYAADQPNLSAAQQCKNRYNQGAHYDEQSARDTYEHCLNSAQYAEDEQPPAKDEPPPARVTVAPPYQGPPPIGWVYGPYTMCGDPPRCSMGVVNVPADGLNVRVAPNGPPVMSLVNGTPLIPLQKQGDWLLVAPACDLTPTWAWSWTAGVPLNRCWVYF